MKTIHIFISSPGDVANERQVCGKIIERLQGRYWSLIRIEDVFWENEALRATGTFQDEIDDPAECEIVIGIIWTKMGSPLPERFTRLDGRTHAPGTEWEIGRAISAYEQKVANGGDPKTSTPHVVVYRRREKRAKLADPDEEAKASAREEEVKEFFAREFHNDDQHRTFKRASISYNDLQDFEAKLLRQLTRLILKQIPVLKSAFNLPPIEGTPYKGLQSFDFTDSDRFFGRTREIRETQRRLIASARKSIPFLLIYGGSGYGKSSLMRAGLAPVITRPGGSLAEIQEWRRVSFQPAKGSGSLCERLARALLQKPDAEEAHHIRERIHWPRTGLAELKEDKAAGGPWDSASLARHFADDSLRPIAINAIKDTLERINRHLLLEVDQLEEIFTTAAIAESPQQGAQTNPHSKNNSQIAAFFATLDALAQSGRVWIVATMRSEFFPRVAETPGLFALVGKDRGYILPPPDRQSLREIIRYPALAARLEFERRDKEILLSTRQENGKTIEEFAKHDFLHDQILADAEDNPDALPLLEFLLQQLFEERKERDEVALLTWDSYVRANGLKGAIAKRATDIFTPLPPKAKEARHRIFAALVHIDPVKGTITRKRAPLVSLKTDKYAEEFLNAFLEAHLLITDEESATKEPVVTLAHEALISHWDELSTWIKDHRSDLLARQRLAEQTKLWVENDKKKSYLLSEARLAEAERVAYGSLFTLTAQETSFIQLSKQRSKRKTTLLQTAVVIFAIVATAAAFFAKKSREETARAEEQKKIATEQLYNAKMNEAISSWKGGDFMGARKAIWDTSSEERSWEYHALAATLGPAPLRITNENIDLLDTPSFEGTGVLEITRMLLTLNRQLSQDEMSKPINEFLRYDAIAANGFRSTAASRDGSLIAKWFSSNHRGGDPLAVFRKSTGEQLTSLQNNSWGGVYAAVFSEDLSVICILADSIRNIQEPNSNRNDDEGDASRSVFIIPIPNLHYLNTDGDTDGNADNDSLGDIYWDFESLNDESCLVRLRLEDISVLLTTDVSKSAQINWEDELLNELNDSIGYDPINAFQIKQINNLGENVILQIDFNAKDVSIFKLLNGKYQKIEKFSADLIDDPQLGYSALGGCISPDEKLVLVSGLKTKDNENEDNGTVGVFRIRDGILISDFTNAKFGPQALFDSSTGGRRSWKISPCSMYALQQTWSFQNNYHSLEVIDISKSQYKSIFTGSYAEASWDNTGKFLFTLNSSRSLVEVRSLASSKLLNSYRPSSKMDNSDLAISDFRPKINRIFAYGSVLRDPEKAPIMTFPTQAVVSKTGNTIAIKNPPTEFMIDMDLADESTNSGKVNLPQIQIIKLRTGWIHSDLNLEKASTAERIFWMQQKDARYRPEGW